MQEMDKENAFANVVRFDFFTQTSPLTGPELLSPGGTSPIFKVIIPIVVLLLVILLAALVYMNWVESHQAVGDEGEGVVLNKKKHRRPDPRKRLYQNRRYRNRQHPGKHTGSDGEHTTPSNVEESSENDEAHSLSESSARFVDDTARPAPRRTKQVRVSPQVVYRTFNPRDIASRVDFEEVSLQDDYDIDECPIPLDPKPLEPRVPGKKNPVEMKKMEVGVSMANFTDDAARILNDDECPIPLDPTPLEPTASAKTSKPEDKVSMTQLMDDFARVLNAAPFVINSGGNEGERTTAVNLQVLPAISSIPWDELSTEHAGGYHIPSARAQDNEVDIVEDYSVETRQIAGLTSEKKGGETSSMETSTTANIAGTKEAPSCDAEGPSSPPLPAPQHLNCELDENMSKLRFAASPQKVTGESTDMEEEFEEVISEDEVTVASEYEEEEVVEEEETQSRSDTVYETDETAKASRSPVPDIENEATMPSTDDVSVASELSQSKLPPQKLRDFWEKKSAKQPTVRDFWEQQSKRKNG
jgi:hypothetical protein